MKKTALFIMALTLLGKCFGLARDLTLSYFYGASNISDAYFISLSIPFVVFVLLGTGITTAYIPMYSKIEHDASHQAALRFTNQLLHLVLMLVTLLVGLGFLFTQPIVTLFASGFDEPTLALAVQFTRISLLGIYFTALIYVFRSYLQIKGSYLVPVLISLPLNVTMVASIIYSDFAGDPLLLAWGSLLATATQLLFMLPFVYKKGYRYQPLISVSDPQIRTMAIIALPVMLGVSVNQLNALVDNTLASQIVEGGVSALNYAYKLNGFVQGLVVSSVVAVMFPLISRLAAKADLERLKSYVLEAIVAIALLVIPATVGAMVFSKQIVTALFGRGAFDEAAIALTSSVLFFYALGMLGFGLRDVLSRAFYALHDTRTPVRNAMLAVLLNIALSLLLSPWFGVGGLALATSLASFVATGLLYFRLSAKIGSLLTASLLLTFVKIIFISLLMGGASFIVFQQMQQWTPLTLSLLITIGCGGALYAVLIRFARIPEVDLLVRQIRQTLFHRGESSEKQ